MSQIAQPSPESSDEPSEKPFHMSKDVKKSWLIALLILGAYAGLAIFGANMIIKMEAAKPNKFKAVEVTQPISFIDKTYLSDDATQSDEPSPNAPAAE